jgi:hypothetical protein
MRILWPASIAKVEPVTNIPPHDQIDVANGHHGDCWNDQQMFICDVEVMETAKRVIPSSVRLHVVDDGGNYGRRRSLYKSTIDGRYHFISRIPERELSVVDGLICPAGYFSGGEVETRSEVVNCVPEDERHTFGHRNRGTFKKALSGIRITLKFKTVEVTLEERIKNFVQVLDVLIGPFDLPTRVTK